MNELLDVIFNINTFSAAIRISVPLVFAAIGGVFSERAGVINLGLEGMLLAGAFAGVLGSYLTGNPYVGVLFAMIAGAFTAWILAVFTLKFEANHVVCGVGLNILLLGITTWLMQIIWGSRGTSDNVTGLTWQQNPGAKMTYNEAVTGAPFQGSNTMATGLNSCMNTYQLNEDILLRSDKNGAVFLSLNRPSKLNTLSEAMLNALSIIFCFAISFSFLVSNFYIL